MKAKYPISEEFGRFAEFTPPLRNIYLAGFIGSLMRPPRSIWRDGEVMVTRRRLRGFKSGRIESLIFEPRGCDSTLPCLVYFHGGGFMLGAADYHYHLAREYALGVPCKVAFVQYRLAPRYKYPTQPEDCYAAYLDILENADELGIDGGRVAIGGDSAGAALAAAVGLMARERGVKMPLFELLVYPVTDRRMQTESHMKYKDTPMWNSILSCGMWRAYLGDGLPDNIGFASPMEADSLVGLPATYIETAEFDCLHDEGVRYAEALSSAGVEVLLYQTRGTMHGYDIVTDAPTVRESIKRRIDYMREKMTEATSHEGISRHS